MMAQTAPRTKRRASNLDYLAGRSHGLSCEVPVLAPRIGSILSRHEYQRMPFPATGGARDASATFRSGAAHQLISFRFPVSLKTPQSADTQALGSC